MLRAVDTIVIHMPVTVEVMAEVGAIPTREIPMLVDIEMAMWKGQEADDFTL